MDLAVYVAILWHMHGVHHGLGTYASLNLSSATLQAMSLTQASTTLVT